MRGGDSAAMCPQVLKLLPIPELKTAAAAEDQGLGKRKREKEDDSAPHSEGPVGVSPLHRSQDFVHHQQRYDA